jgi:hypothetical protein
MVSLRQFDVVPNPSLRTRATHPYFVVLQSDLLEDFATRIVAPLIPPAKIKYLEKLLPQVKVGGKNYVVAIPDLGPIPAKLLKPAVANLETERYRLLAALDLLFTGA